MSFEISKKALGALDVRLATSNREAMDRLLRMDSEALKAIAIRAKLRGGVLDLLNPSTEEMLGAVLITAEQRFLSSGDSLDAIMPFERLEQNLLSGPIKAFIYMEQTGGSPAFQCEEEGFWIVDNAPEVPLERRFFAYNQEAKKWWDEQCKSWWIDTKGRKEEEMDGICLGSALSDEVDELGLGLMTLERYAQFLRKHDQFDGRSATWLKTPDSVLSKGRAYVGSRSDRGRIIDDEIPTHNTCFPLGARYEGYFPWTS